MRLEYRHLAAFGGWMFLWTFLPWVALPLMLFMVARHFVLLRRYRQNQELAARLHANDSRWIELEGFGHEERQPDSADWWKR